MADPMTPIAQAWPILQESSGSISGDKALHLTLRRMATSLLQNTWVDPEGVRDLEPV